jgi:type VI secretion system protein
MLEERLLRRIRGWEVEPLGRSREDPKKILDSVVHHLQRLLNTHQGSASIAPDYGIPDLMHLLQRGPDAAYEVENIIRDTIEKYEPRLTGVRVRFVTLDDGQLSLRFHIQGKLRLDAKPVTLETVVSSDGSIQVKS